MAPTHTRVEKYDALKQKNRLDFIFKKKKKRLVIHIYQSISILMMSSPTRMFVCLFFVKDTKKKKTGTKTVRRRFSERASEREKEGKRRTHMLMLNDQKSKAFLFLLL